MELTATLVRPSLIQESVSTQTDCEPSKSPADQLLEQKILQFFNSRHVPGLRNVGVDAKNGIVTITGKVLTFYEKQLCSQCSKLVPGIQQLINSVHVCGTSHAMDHIRTAG